MNRVRLLSAPRLAAHVVSVFTGWILLTCPLAAGGVIAVEEPMVLPTYEMGSPDPNPIFYTQESYQGAQKRVYPYALQDHLLHTKTNRTYQSLRLENDFIRVIVLPEIGGRLFEGTDKSNGYPFFYRQHVIKPALIGMLGAWVSGGIEWCAFHHHRNTTQMTIDHRIAENRDGSKTVWIGETERRHRMKWLIGITLHPDRSYLEVNGRFFNRTPLPHSILNWANVAVHVNEDYQILFPPSVRVATYHSKIDFSRWPISQERYRGVDYRGVDLSWWKNHPNPVSFFAWDLAEDFMGGYDHGKQAGVVHVANHHMVGGAKLWEWGTGPEGRAWDKVLTDDDGPYAELMVGAYSDNQPDYSWLQPAEIKAFQQFWYPVRDIGGFKSANREAAINLELRTNGVARVGVQVTAPHRRAKVVLRAGDRVLFEETLALSPAKSFVREIAVPPGTRETELRAALVAKDGRELIAYQPRVLPPVDELPTPVRPPAAPKDIASADELYWTGLRIEQIHNPSVDPAQYYEEVLRRDSGDSRANTRLAWRALRRGDDSKAEEYSRAALARVTAEYTRPVDAEAHFCLGLSLRGLGRDDDACDQFYRATWDAGLHSAAYGQLAELSCRRRDFERALGEINQSLITGSHQTKALGLQAAILRRLGRFAEATLAAQTALDLDPLDFLARNELHLAQASAGRKSAARGSRSELTRLMRGEVESYLELATDYLNAGLWDEATGVLERLQGDESSFAATYPLVHYYLGYLHERKGDRSQAAAAYARAGRMPLDYCFPFRLETARVLEAALASQPADAHAWYLLGNLWFDLQPERALACWEKSRALDDSLAIVHRNLGWGYYRVGNNLTNALASYEKAIARNARDARWFLELDQLYELSNVEPERRLAGFEQNFEVIRKRMESFSRAIAVQVGCSRYDAAIGHLSTNFFHVREGGGEIHDVYVDAHLLQGIQRLEAKDAAQALGHFQKASEYPENLSVGRPKNDRRAPQVAYFTGVAQEALGQTEAAKASHQKSADQSGTGGWPETRFYQGLSFAKLGRPEEAAKVFDQLIERGNRDLERGESADFFAKFGEQEARQMRAATAHYTIGLGHLGRGNRAQARAEFEQAVRLNRSHVWAKHELARAGARP